MKKDEKVYLDDIWECIEKIEEYTKNITEDVFLEDTKIQDSVMRRIEIIGEAVKNLPSEFKERHLNIPWKQIAGMRDILIHEYSGIHQSRVWKVVEKDIPKLRKELRKIYEKI